MTDQSSDHWSEIAGDYAAFRPHYPRSLFEWLGAITTSHQLAWDAGTGNGQAAVALTSFFSRVVATDKSPGQIEQAVDHPRVEYRVAPAERSGLDPDSVDLVTVAQALHWFDTVAVFAEMNRVLVPTGAVVAWTYGVVHADEPRVDQLLNDFYYREIGPYWPANRKLVEEGYQSIAFPFTRIKVPAFEMKVDWTLAELLGYIGTWSAVRRYRKENGEDPVPRLEAVLAGPWGKPLDRREIRWPLSVLAGVKGKA